MTPTKLKKPRKPKAEDKVKSRSDEKGNLLIIKNNGKRIILSLKLVAETRYRRLGVVNLAQKTLECRRKFSKHLLRKANAYGFNYNLLDTAKLFDKVRLMDEQNEWVIPREWILKNGSFLWFLHQGFERQIFANLVDIEQFKIEAKI